MSMRVIVVGDVCLAGEPERVLATNSRSPWTGVGAWSPDTSILVANLEHPLAAGGCPRPSKWANLRALPESVQLLAGLDAAVLANNHLSDYGNEAAQETVARLRAAGILSIGFGRNLEEATRPLVLQRGAVKLAIVALSCPTTNGENVATHLDPGVAPLGAEIMRQAITGAKQIADLVLVYLHWGCEQVHDPVPDQIRLGRMAVDCGAHAVVGCHSHTIQSYEQYRGRWIFHGLGNYLFGPVSTREILPDGRELLGLQVQMEPNRESLVVTFEAVEEHGELGLCLKEVKAVNFDAAYAHHEIPVSGLSFDLRATNLRLQRYGERYAADMSSTREPWFRTTLRNGVLAYFYERGPISDLDLAPPPPPPTRLRRLACRIARRLGV